jgi:hypothetical protein
MLKFYLYIITLTYTTALLSLSSWQQPDPRLKYHQVTFLTSHNSYAAKKHGFFYAQQYWTIQEQLEHGTRGLMLDTYYNSTKTDVVLCHKSLFINRFLKKGRPPMTLKESLLTIKTFLENNPTEIITIFLENYVDNGHLLDSAIRSSDIEHFILKPHQWDPCERAGWPTLRWMQQHNKRLLIFNSIEKTELTFNEWEHVIENQYGALITKQACAERIESQKWRRNQRHLYLVNYFSTFKLNLGRAYHAINTVHLQSLMREINQGLDSNGLYKMRSPNFIALDYVNEGDAMNYINKMNILANIEKIKNSAHRSNAINALSTT